MILYTMITFSFDGNFFDLGGFEIRKKKLLLRFVILW